MTLPIHNVKQINDASRELARSLEAIGLEISLKAISLAEQDSKRRRHQACG